MKNLLIEPLSRLACFVAFAAIASGQSIDVGRGQISIRQDADTKIIRFNRGAQPGPITCEFLAPAGAGKALNDPQTPVFEFVLDHRLVQATDAAWTFLSHSIRRMGNGGQELRLRFRGARPPVDGLEIEWIQQAFPGTTLMREKLVLSAGNGRRFALHKQDDRLHFEFPRYSLIRVPGDAPAATEIRFSSWDQMPITFPDRGGQRANLGNHMFYPVVQTGPLASDNVKGPVSFVHLDRFTWLTAYEHASQDTLNGFIRKGPAGGDGRLRDGFQDTSGTFDFTLKDTDFKFLGIARRQTDAAVTTAVTLERGGYLDGEVIDTAHPYSTVWTASGFYPGRDLETGQALLRAYLSHWICERDASRRPVFYYNTWGMQRSRGRKLGEAQLRGSMTYERLLAEIERAHQLGVQLFVLDDGWEEAQGIWTPNKQRLPQGLAPIKAALDQRGMTLGVWFSPMGIDASTERYRQHPEWVIRDSRGQPLRAQWNHPAFDFVSGFRDLFVADCKALIDQGVRFMKWDAINNFFSTLPDLDHGTRNYSPDEIRARYDYLLPIYVVDAMAQLTAYEPDLVIEIDLTEAGRALCGLAPLSQGKLYFVNNGASGYDDFSPFRTKCMRTIANAYAGLIPLELFTYALYPHNNAGAMAYNVNTALIAGHGLWGDLEQTTESDRQWTGQQVARSKRVLPYLVDSCPEVIGQVGDSPEIYTQVNREAAAGQVIAFSSRKLDYPHRVMVKADALLAVLDHSYSLDGDAISLPLAFPEGDSTRAAFILPNKGAGIVLRSSTTALTAADWNEADRTLAYTVSEAGRQVLRWPHSGGIPEVTSQELLEVTRTETADAIMLTISNSVINQRVVVEGRRAGNK